MKITENYAVEMADGLRFTTLKDGSTVERYAASPETRVDPKNAKLYHIYRGTLVEATADDFTDIAKVDALARRIKQDIYGESTKSAAECLADLVSNGGCRLAYGDSIKARHKTAPRYGRVSQSELTRAFNWAMDECMESLAPIAKEDRAQWAYQEWIRAGKP